MNTYQIVQAINEASAGRWMMFVDGENFTLSLQRLVTDQGFKLLPGSHYVPDVCECSPRPS